MCEHRTEKQKNLEYTLNAPKTTDELKHLINFLFLMPIMVFKAPGVWHMKRHDYFCSKSILPQIR